MSRQVVAMISVMGHPAQEASAAMPALTAGCAPSGCGLSSTAPGTSARRRKRRPSASIARRLLRLSRFRRGTGRASIASFGPKPRGQHVDCCLFHSRPMHAPWRAFLVGLRDAAARRRSGHCAGQWALRRGSFAVAPSSAPDMRQPLRRERTAPAQIPPETHCCGSKQVSLRVNPDGGTHTSLDGSGRATVT